MIYSYLINYAKTYGSDSDEHWFILVGIIIVSLIIGILYFISYIKNKLFDEPRNKIFSLERQISDTEDKYKKELEETKNSYSSEIENIKISYSTEIEILQKIHKKELNILSKRLDKAANSDISLIKEEYADIISCYAIREIYELCHKEFAFLDIPYRYTERGLKKGSTVDNIIQDRVRDAIEEQYKFKYIILLYPELQKLFDGSDIDFSNSIINNYDNNINISVFEIVNLLKNKADILSKFFQLDNKIKFLEASQSNLTAIPYMAQIMADYETYGLEDLAKSLDWGYAKQRLHKVKAIREIRKDAQAMVEKNKEAQYQLAYLLELFPNLQDIIDCEFKQLPPIKVEQIADYDATRDYLSKEEYATLSSIEKNQLALDRYKKSHSKSKWQIGRDYELFIGYSYSKKGYDVDYFGSYMGLEDLGRDLICKKDGKTLIIQCKYWSSSKMIHEKHVTQLYGTMMSYCIENNCKKTDVKGILITNITLSDTAQKMAKFLNIQYKENIALGNYPCIKCNINYDSNGYQTKIYHLPFDQKYDTTKITKNGEFFATTIEEAEKAGFRRAYKWFGTN